MKPSTDDCRALIELWGALWEAPHLANSITITFSDRLTKSLGHCRPSTGRITLNATLLDSPPELLAEVLCHEAAHIAAAQKAAQKTRPHGPEWQELVIAAGYPPQVRSNALDRKASPQPSIFLYEHRCPVCHSVRFGRRAQKSWRCAECLDNGLDGTMVITRLSNEGVGP